MVAANCKCLPSNVQVVLFEFNVDREIYRKTGSHLDNIYLKISIRIQIDLHKNFDTVDYP